jgi:clan AA aspartic protease (TIGR02281 family)
MNWKPAILAAAFAALTWPCAAADLVCQISDEQSNHLVYSFDWPGSAPQVKPGLGSAMIEVGFTKNYDDPIVGDIGRRPVWTYVQPNSGGNIAGLWSRKDKDWGIGFVHAGGAATLWHSDHAIGQGSCHYEAGSRHDPDPDYVRTPAPATPPPSGYAVAPTANCVDRSSPLCGQSPAPPPATVARSDDSVALFTDDGGRSLHIGVDLNDGVGPHQFLLDTGATNVTVTENIADDLLRYDEAAEIDPGRATLADGSERLTRRIVIKTLTVGSHVLHDVVAGVNPNDSQMLLGWSVLNRIGKFTIDAVNGKLIFNG